MDRPRPPKRPHGPARTGPRPPQGLPDRATLLAFIRESGEADRSDIARAFGLKGADRIALRDMLRDLQDSGDLGRRGRRSLALPGQLPPVGVVEVIDRDPDGELMVRLMKGEDTPMVRLAPDPNPTSRQTIPVVPLTSLIGELLIVVENVAAAGVSVEDVTNVPPVSVKFTPPSLL
jgi:ribonuclease R